MFKKPFLIKILKRTALALGLLLVLSVFLGFLFHEDVKDWILEEIDQYISEVQSGDLKIEDVELALFQHLPNITVRLKNLEYYEQKDSVRPVEENPILFAENLYLAFEPWQFIRYGNLKVSSMSLIGANCNLVEYENNTLNLENALLKPVVNQSGSAKKDTLNSKGNKEKNASIQNAEKANKPENPVSSFNMDLKEFELRDIIFNYQNLADQKTVSIDISSLDGEIFINATGLTSDIKSQFEILEYSDFPLIADLGSAVLELKLDYIDSEDEIIVNKGHYKINGLTIDVKGSYAHTKGREVDMEFDASANDMTVFSKIIQDEVLRKNEALLQKANIVLRGKLSGEMANKAPMLDLEFGVKDLSFTALDGQGEFKDIGFAGEFHSGEKADYSQAMLEIRDISGKLPGGAISGYFHFKNLVDPYLKYDVNARLSLDGYDEQFQIPDIDSLRGRVSLQAKFDGTLDLQKEYKRDGSRRWKLEMSDIGFYVPSTRKTISRFNGSFEEVGNKLLIKDLGLDYDGSNALLNGEISNLYHFVFKNEKDIEVNMDISSSQFYTRHVVLNPELGSLIDERGSDLVLKVQAYGKENDSINSKLPWFAVDLEQLSFKLDTLVDLPELKASIDLYDTHKGLRIDLNRMHAKMPKGSIDLSGNVIVMDSARLLDAHADMTIKGIPESYLLDVVYEMKDLTMMSEQERNLSENTLYDGNLHLSGIIETMPFAMPKAQIKESDLTMRPPNGSVYEFNKVNLKLDSLYFLHEKGSNKITGIRSAKGDLAIDEFNTPIVAKVPLDANFTAKNDQFLVNFSTLRDIKIEDHGIVALDISKDLPEFEISYNLKDVPIENVVEIFSQKNLANGMLDASFLLKGSGFDLEELIKTAKGKLNFKGDSITLHGIDIDKLLKKYKRSQNFNLIDIGAYVVVGPVGAVVTKGGDFLSLIGSTIKEEDTTYVAQALANWKFQDGIIETKDVAFNTSLNRFSFDGKFDILNDSIPGFTAYVLDKNACSLMEQKVSGKLDNLQVGKLKIAKTLLGSVINLVNAVVGKECEPVYHGAVRHPIPLEKNK